MEKEAKSAEPDMGAGPGAKSGAGAEPKADARAGGEMEVGAGARTAAESGAGAGAPSPHGNAHRAANVAPDPMPDEEMLYDLADLFKVFGDTTRIKILYALMGTELCVADITDLVGATQSAVSHQLRTLKQARLVKFQRDGKNVIYALSDDHVYTMLAQGMTHICE